MMIAAPARPQYGALAMATEPTQHAAPSLMNHLTGWRIGRVSTHAAMIVGALLVAAPVATLGGAALLTMRADDDRESLERQHAADIDRARTAATQRRDLSAVLAVPGIGATLEVLARTLPRETLVRRAARGRDGRLMLEVTTADPDRLRAALRREPATATLRDAGQRRGESGLIVTLVGS